MVVYAIVEAGIPETDIVIVDAVVDDNDTVPVEFTKVHTYVKGANPPLFELDRVTF